MRITQVDAFADRPFRGNPAAVCVLDAPADDAWMQNVALEMNLSETAFLHPDEAGGYRLRWFTPTVEVDLCGHATVASAHVLWEEGHLDPNTAARFHTRSGLLSAERASDGWIWLDFPLETPYPAEAPPGLAAALGAEPLWVGRNRMDLLVEVADERTVREMRPDLGGIERIPLRGVIVTARGDAGGPYDFVSRFFAPQSGVAEDPVTGSAHCGLTPYWAERTGKREMTGFQASARGGVVRVRDRGADRVAIGGQAVTTLRGELLA